MLFDLSQDGDVQVSSEGLEGKSGSAISQYLVSDSPSTPQRSTKRRKCKNKSPEELALIAAIKKANQDARKVKASAKETVKQVKAQEKIIAKQRQGFYRKEELSLVLSDDLYNSSLGAAILSHLMFTSDNDKSYGCISAPSCVSGLCRWTYRNYLDGGNATIGESGCIVIPFAVIIFPPQEFLRLVDDSPDGVEFPSLNLAIQELRAKLTRDQCPANSKLVLLLIDIDKACKQYKSNRGKISNDRKLTWTLKIDEAVGFLLYSANVDVVMRNTSSEHKQVAKYFETVTRCLGEQASQQKSSTGLESLKRIPSKLPDVEQEKNKHSIDDVNLREIFCCMLQVVPGMSRIKAENLQEYFPYPQLLVDALSNPLLSECERKMILADKIDPKRNNVRLAAQLYKIFTSLNPDEALV